MHSPRLRKRSCLPGIFLFADKLVLQPCGSAVVRSALWLLAGEGRGCEPPGSCRSGSEPCRGRAGGGRPSALLACAAWDAPAAHGCR